MDIKQALLVRGNKAFLDVTVARTLCSKFFEQVVHQSMVETQQCSVGYNGYLGRMIVDSTKAVKRGRSALTEAILGGVLKTVAMSLPDRISGVMQDEAVVLVGQHSFHFKIGGYEQMGVGDGSKSGVWTPEPLGNPFDVEADKWIGRVVQFAIQTRVLPS